VTIVTKTVARNEIVTTLADTQLIPEKLLATDFILTIPICRARSAMNFLK